MSAGRSLLSFARVTKIAALCGDLADAQLIGVMNHRHDQAVINRGRNSKIDLMIQLNSAVAPTCIQARMIA